MPSQPCLAFPGLEQVVLHSALRRRALQAGLGEHKRKAGSDADAAPSTNAAAGTPKAPAAGAPVGSSRQVKARLLNGLLGSPSDSSEEEAAPHGEPGERTPPGNAEPRAPG